MSRPFRPCTWIVLLVLALTPVTDAKKDKKEKRDGEEETEDASPLNSKTLSGLKFRTIGPALTSGRIADLAVSPADPDTWFVAAASGGVWKTTNHGTTFTPVFDGEGSYSIGCVSIDPNNPAVVWVGTGENNSQRSVGPGDGVYKSIDGGKSWENVGLKDSEHIGKILIDPRDSNVVYVAAQGGDRHHDDQGSGQVANQEQAYVRHLVSRVFFGEQIILRGLRFYVLARQ